MSKRRISQRQAQRIDKSQQNPPADKDNPQLGPEQPGIVIAHYGRNTDVENDTGLIFQCALRQHLGDLVAGDRVSWKQIGEHSGIITAKQPRTSVLTKQNKYGKIKPIAAQIHQMIIVLAPEPPPNTLLIDSYIVAAEIANITPIIVWNKMDIILDKKDDINVLEQLSTFYPTLGYDFIKSHTIDNSGLTHLMPLLKDKTSVFVGQSGVGKSSLIQSILPDASISVGDLSMNTFGKHTTTTAKLYHLPQGGDLIDSPGIRSLTLETKDPAAIAQGFLEFHPFLSQCQFRNCGHQQEKGCQIQHAIKTGQIPAWRWQNFIKMTLE